MNVKTSVSTTGKTSVTTSKKANHVLIEGYLKENNLMLFKTANGTEVIKGSIIIAVDETNAHRVQYYVPKVEKSGNVSKAFESLIHLLPNYTISIANYLKTTPTANFATASAAATKVWATGRLEEFASKDENRGKETSMVLIKGRSGGIKELDSKHPFLPRATFNCDVYIESIIPEYNSDKEETGRIILTGLLPVYDGSMYRIGFVAGEENSAAEYVQDNYAVGMTVNLDGVIIAMSVVKTRSIPVPGGFGSGLISQPETYFIRERRITGAKGGALTEDAEGAIKLQDVKDGLAVREENAIKNFQSRNRVSQPSSGSVVNSTPIEGSGDGVSVAPSKASDFSNFEF